MDPVLLETMATIGMRAWATYQDSQANGGPSDAFIDAQLAAIGHDADTFQVLVDAHKAKG